MNALCTSFDFKFKNFSFCLKPVSYTHLIDDINECKDCNFNIFCLGGCRAQSLFHNKNICSKYPSCKYEKQNYEQILWSPLKPIESRE